MIKALETNDGTLIIPEGFEQIPESACTGREDIRRVILPQSVYSIGPEAFAECTALEEVVLPDSFLHISAAAFLNCSALTRVKLSRNLQSINEGAFLGCTALKTLDLPNTLEFIGEMAFWNSGLEEIAIPTSVKQISENAFGNCPLLTEGFIAPGYPEDDSPPAQLLYTLLWCSCPQRHSPETAQRAAEFIRQQEGLMMERILKSRNAAALNGIVSQGLLEPSHVDGYIQECAKIGATELTALLLQAKHRTSNMEEEFDL